LIVPVHPDLLGKDWQFYRRGIEQIISFGGVSFLPEDVYHHIKAEKAFLYRVGDVGFFVLEKCKDPTAWDHYLNVWLMWFQPGSGIPFKKEILAFLDGAKEAAGCSSIRMGTTREGWLRLLDGDFKQHMIILERK
jgi:hypothetical protein